MGQHESPYGSFFYSTIGETFFYCSFYRTCLPAVVSNDLEDLSNMAFLLTYSGKYQESFDFLYKNREEHSDNIGYMELLFDCAKRI